MPSHLYVRRPSILVDVDTDAVDMDVDVVLAVVIEEVNLEKIEMVIQIIYKLPKQDILLQN